MTFLGMKISKLESYGGLGLSIVAAILTALNISGDWLPGTAWHSLITYGLPALAAFGIAPITSAKLDTLLHLTPKVVAALATVDGILIALVQTFGWSATATGIVTGVLTLIGGVVFGSVTVTVPPVPAPTPAPKGKSKGK